VSGPKISVVLPVRNGERFLREAIESVLEQCDELIVVDDGSTDESAEIAAGLGATVLRQKPLGLVAALKRGVDQSNAAYVARMDADDVSLPGRLERQIAFLEAHPSAAFVVPGVELIDEADTRVGEIVLPPDDASLRRRLLLRNPFTHGSVVIRRTALEATGGYRADYGANEDYDLWRRLARDWELAALGEILYRYRRHGAATTATDPERVAQRERLRDELWREPTMLGALWGERDYTEAKALVREAVRRRRPRAALRAAAGYLASAASS
jgi:glycosyltransferase involved in cell wall biosynthesis